MIFYWFQKDTLFFTLLFFTSLSLLGRRLTNSCLPQKNLMTFLSVFVFFSNKKSPVITKFILAIEILVCNNKQRKDLVLRGWVYSPLSKILKKKKTIIKPSNKAHIKRNNIGLDVSNFLIGKKRRKSDGLSYSPFSTIKYI